MEVTYDLVKMITRIVFASPQNNGAQKMYIIFPKKHRSFWGKRKCSFRTWAGKLFFAEIWGYMGQVQVSVCSKGGLPYSVSGCVPKRCTAPDEKTSHAYKASMKSMVKTLSNCYSFNKKMGVFALWFCWILWPYMIDNLYFHEGQVYEL